MICVHRGDLKRSSNTEDRALSEITKRRPEKNILQEAGKRLNLLNSAIFESVRGTSFPLNISLPFYMFLGVEDWV